MTKLSGLSTESTFGSTDYMVKVKAAGGGDVLVSLADFITAFHAADNNPYKFSAYLSANQTGLTDATLTKVLFDAELFDTNANFASSKYTAPVSGYYQVNAHASLSSGSSAGVAGILSLYKNGSEILRNDIGDFSGAHTSTVHAATLSDIVQLTAGDFLEIYVYLDVTTGTVFVNSGTKNTRFNAFFVSAT